MSTDLDMVWVPWSREWCCIRCFDHYFFNMTLNEFIQIRGEDINISGRHLDYLAKKYKGSFLTKRFYDPKFLVKFILVNVENKSR
ncbi:hypothetical protein LCGC14_2285250 [marine sediment metagenome]|uniref:Uncharacterized protein n=1 Tax=marine sediment metagenome TaxID=412755 RepID=A0A0F9F5E6_9ZZZZ